MSLPDTCRHGRPECECQAKARVFEHDFSRLTQQTRAAHMFYEAGMFAQAELWLEEIVDVARGLATALHPCDHQWVLKEGTLTCERCECLKTRN